MTGILRHARNGDAAVGNPPANVRSQQAPAERISADESFNEKDAA
ncbi:hypothetical protein [Nitratireductor sp. ZSWI3]|nr:hypothetical protein [Nitratireductor sp. ZSWI3]MCR4267557.1 hypothetical protein [Nitratireductor sp. ZSWI3]